MEVISTKIADVKLIIPRVFQDSRGFFMETFRECWFRQNVDDVCFVQDNHSASVQNTLRGLHFQEKNQQGKLVRVVRGCVFDVAVDLRRESSTFGEHVSEILSSDNKNQLWIPPGFAHGFYVMSSSAEIVYSCTNYYDPESERCIWWGDSSLGIDWPLIDGMRPLLSAKDLNGEPFSRFRDET